VATSHEQKHGALNDFYSNLLGVAKNREFTLNLGSCHRNMDDLGVLDLPITGDEVWTAVFCLPSDRALGSDGFTRRFYKSCWHIIKDDMLAAIIALHQGNSRGLWLLNSAYLTVIPKKIDATTTADFRPISLIHSFAKLVTKIMANRLAPLLPRLVAANQSAFVRGRSIHDNYMFVQHSIKSLHRWKVSSLFLKLDITKAFDSVSWAFLLEVLSHLGFGLKWRNLISNLLASSSTQVLLNGVPSDHIWHRRGLRQGDPLSPMLFIIVMDVLGNLFRHAESRGLLHSLGAANVRSRLSMYADDVVLFVKPLDDDLVCTKLILDCFGEASGLVANMNKSCAIPICCVAPLVRECCNTLQYVVSTFPCTYLGLPISNKKLRRSDLIDWVDKIAARLPNCKASLLNLAGRTTLVRFVLSAIPVYLLIAMIVHKWVIKAIDKIRRPFLWKGRKEINGGCCLVAWEKVTRPLHLDGLGLPNLLYRSWVLQARWLWLQKTDPSRSWIGLDIPVQPQVKALVAISVISHVGNGNDTLF
jgi:hypothetical protein